MGFLAYDPERLPRLRTATSAALRELETLDNDDPDAAGAMRVVRLARVHLTDIWMPLLDRLLRCAALTDRRPAELDPGDLRDALPYLMVTRLAWTPAIDPLESQNITAHGAAALAERLQAGDIAQLTDDPAELSWLTAQLAAIAAQASLTRAFVARFTRWADLCDALTWQRITSADSPTALVDEAFTQLAAVWVAHIRLTTPHSGAIQLLPQLDMMEPYSAAALARYMVMSSAQRAALTDHLLRRWAHGDSDDDVQELGWTDRNYAGPNTADLLFGTLLADPPACTQYLQLAADDPQTFLMTAADPVLAHRVVQVATDPAHVDPATAGDLLVPLLRSFADGAYLRVEPAFEADDPSWTPFLGELVAPWLLQFSPLNDDWSTPPEERRDLLAFVLHDDAAMERLLGAADAAVDGLASTLRRRGRSGTDLEELAAFVGLLGGLNLDERVADEERRQAAWDLCWTLVSLPTRPLGGAAGKIAHATITSFRYVAESRGWLAAPSPGRVRDQARYQQQWMLTVTGATMATIAFDRLVQRGALTADVKPPPAPDPSSDAPQLAYERAYQTWKRTVFDGPDDVRAAEVDAWKSPFLNAADAGAGMVP